MIMNKPKQRDDLGNISIYNGYFLIDSKTDDKYCYYALKIGYRLKNQAIEEINHLINKRDIEDDIKEIKQKIENTKSKIFTLENDLQEKINLLKKLEN